MKFRYRIYRRLGIVSPSGKWPLPVSKAWRRAGELAAEGVCAGIRGASSLPGSQSLAATMGGPQTAAQSRCTGDPFDWRPCRGDCPDPLRPRSERCPETDCTDEQQCWRCDAEEAAHTCEKSEGTAC